MTEAIVDERTFEAYLALRARGWFREEAERQARDEALMALLRETTTRSSSRDATAS